MIKKLYESFEKKLKETTNEKVNLTLESLAELNEEEHDEQVIKDTLYIGPRKYSLEIYPDVENGYIAHWEDDSDNGFGYNNKGWVNLSKNSQMLAFKEKGYADIEDYISVISVYDRSLRPEVKQEIIKKVLEVRGERPSEDLEESVSKELVDEFADQYGLSKEEAKRRLSHLSKEEQEAKLKALRGVRSNNAKIEIETEALTEDSDFKEREYNKMFRYTDINEAPWFKEIVKKAVKNSERSGNRISVYFGSEEDALEAISKLSERNISHIDDPMENRYDNTFRVDIFYNFKEGRPSKEKRNKELVLESLDDNTKKEVEIELEDILRRNPKEYDFAVDTEEIKEYVRSLLKEKGYEVEVSADDSYKPSKYRIAYFKAYDIED